MIFYLCGLFFMDVVYFRQNMESINNTVEKALLKYYYILEAGF